MREDFLLRSLTAEDTSDILTLLESQPADYLRFFRPFPFDYGAISKLLGGKKRDVYTGIYCQNQIVALITLRGWDEGYEEPAFGVVVADKFRGTGLEMIALESAKLICHLRHAPGMITKVHPENMSVKGVMRKIGFTLTGSETSGKLIYRLELKPKPLHHLERK